MKKCAKEISEPLAFLFNMSFSNRIFPESLKLADIIPIHKKEMAKHLLITTGQYSLFLTN